MSWCLIKFFANLPNWVATDTTLKAYVRTLPLPMRFLNVFALTRKDDPLITQSAQSASVIWCRIYTTKINESARLSICVSGYDFRHALRYGAETWNGDWGIGSAYFLSDSSNGQGHPEVKLLWNALWPPNLLGRTPWPKCKHCWGQR